MPARVVIIGAGVIGAALAAELSRCGAEVTVVDAARPAGGTSGATFSWTNSNDKQPRAYHDLNVGGMLAHRRFADQVAGADWYHGGGNLEWKDGAKEKARLATKVDRLRDHGYPVRWLTRAEVSRLEPDLAPDRVPDDGVAFYPDEGWVEPTRLVAVLLDAARANGARVRTGDPVTSFDTADGRISVVRTGSGAALGADAVVDCAGPDAAAVADLAGVDLPMRNTQGVLTYLQPMAVAVRRVVHSPRVHLRPDGGGRLLLHTEEVDRAAHRGTGGEWTVAPEATDRLVAEAGTVYPGLAGARIEAVRVGVRPIPGDGLPVLGRSSTVDNFHLAVMHSGATLCLRVAELLAPEIVGGTESPELAPFRHSRLVPAAGSPVASVSEVG